MPTLSTTRQIDAPIETVWGVLDDYGNIARWSPGIARSEVTSIGPVGVGTTRHCKFKPFGSADERIEGYVAGKLMKIRLHNISGMPLSEAAAEFRLRERGTGTELTLLYDYTLPAFARFLSLIFKKKMGQGLDGIIDGLEAECNAVRAAGRSQNMR